jgi:hypothetical protein
MLMTAARKSPVHRRQRLSTADGTPAAHWLLYEDDILLLDGAPSSLERLVSRGGLKPGVDDEAEGDRRPTSARRWRRS